MIDPTNPIMPRDDFRALVGLLGYRDCDDPSWKDANVMCADALGADTWIAFNAAAMELHGSWHRWFDATADVIDFRAFWEWYCREVKAEQDEREAFARDPDGY